MTSNTEQDFLNTANSEDSYITCPACGSPLGIRTQGYEMILTDNFKLELDTNIASLRLFLDRLETLLEQRNLPIDSITSASYIYSQERDFYSDHVSDIGDDDEDNVAESKDKRRLLDGGLYYGTIGKDAANDFVTKTLDFFQYIKNFDKFPLKSEKEEERLYRECKSLLRGIEPRSIAGPIIDLIFDQRNVFQWRQELELEQKREKLNNLLNEVCPTIQWYLNKLLELEKKFKDDPNIPRAVLRAQLVLALMLGHKSDNTDTYGLKKVSISKNVRFTLPRLTVVSYKNLLRLLHSEIVLGNPKLRLNRGFQKRLKSSRLNPLDSNNTTEEETVKEQVLQEVKEWGKEIHKLIHFSCTGSSGRELKRCGWYPKEGETHSIILLGSPGTGKSSVMLTGLVAFCDYIAALGATVALDLPDDREQMRRLDDNYRKGIMPDRTLLGDKTSIRLSVQFPEIHPSKRTHFVFTDIPGEDLARSLTEEGSLSWVLKILKNAETVVFFFDLSIEPTIREKLTKTRNADIFKQVLENYERVNKHREGKAAVRQFDLLEQLLNDLRTQRGDLDGINFICVIPKSDLYARKDSDSERLFFTSFYDQMETMNLLVKSDFDKQDDESFDGLCSLGGTGFKYRGSKDSKNNKNKALIQRYIGRQISQKAHDCLLEIGNALGEEAVPEFKITLKELIQVRLINRLQTTFSEDKVFFLPVSAQGKDTSRLLEDDNSKTVGGISLGGIPNQKLSEYVFLLPVALSVSENLEG